MKYANKKMKQNQGFTLIELLMTLVIVGVMASLAVPNVTETIQRARVNASADTLYALIRFTRAEATRRGSTVFIGAIDGNNWANGAAVWTETDGNGLYDNGTDTLIRRSYVKGKLIMNEQTSQKVIAFNGQGYTATAVKFDIFDSRGIAQGRTINILVSGFSAMKQNGSF